MSASSITDGIINNLSAVSAIGSCQVDTNWSVLETTAACAGVVTLPAMESAPWAMNNQHERFYTHRVSLYVKDRGGNGVLLERDIQGLIDTSVCSLESDRALQGSEDIREISTLTAAHDAERSVQAGGATWYVATIDIRTREWPDN
jgi:hypothetical protein